MQAEELIHNKIIWGIYNGQPLSVTDTHHVFLIEVNRFLPHLSNYKSILSEEELTKSERFYRSADRENYLVRKYALRQLLSRFLQLPPQQIEYHRQANKKPGTAHIQFNSSHTQNQIAIAISHHPIGIDIETEQSGFDFTELLNSCFSKEESELITTSKNQQQAFYTLWTRKEALIKATGEGMTENLDLIPSIPATIERNHQYYRTETFLRNNCLISLAYTDLPRTFSFWEY